MNIFKNISILDIDSCLQNTFDIKKKKLKLKNKLKQCNTTDKECKNVFEISQTDFHKCNGFTITCSGVYKLTENIKWTKSACPAITIKSTSCVTIDFNGYCIDLGNQGLIGIRVVNSTDIVIKNGTIRNGNLTSTITDDLIFYVPSTTNPFLSPNPTNLTNIGGRTAGINLVGSDVVKIKNMTIDRFLYGISSSSTVGHIDIDRCNIVNGGNQVNEPNPVSTGTPSTLLQPVGAGILLAGSSVVPILTSPANTIGVMTDVRIRNCNIHNPNTRYGIVIISGNGIVEENNYVTSGRPDINSPINFLMAMAAFQFINSQFGLVKNCKARFGYDGIQAAWCNNIDMVDNNAGNIGHNGFEIAFANNCTIENCITSRSADAEPRAIGGRGITILSCTNCIVEKCKITDYTVGATNPPIVLPRQPNTPPVGNPTNGYGVSLVACKACVVKDNTAVNNLGGFQEFIGPIAIVFPGGSTPIPAGSVGNPAIPDWNSFLRNIAEDNTNTTTAFTGAANNYNLPPYQAAIPGIVTPYTALGTAPAWTNIAIPNNLGGNPAV